MQTKEQRSAQAIDDHMKSQAPSISSIRISHPRAWQRYKLSNISTLAFLQEIGDESATTEELVNRLPLLVRKGTSAMKVCESKIKQLRKLGLIDYIHKPGTWHLTPAGTSVLMNASFRMTQPDTKEARAFGLHILILARLLLNETTYLYYNKTIQEVITLYEPVTGPQVDYIMLSCRLRQIMLDLKYGKGYDDEPLQLGMCVGAITERLRNFGHDS